MINLLVSGVLILMVVSGCGWNGNPTRNDYVTPLTAIKIAAASSNLAVNTTTTLTATGNFSGLFARDVTSQVVWSSTSPDVAAFMTSASPNRVTGIKAGTAILVATVGSVSSTYTLTVRSDSVTSITISPTTSSLPKGLTLQYSATGHFSDNTTQDLTADATWASSALAVATVGNAAGNKGFVTAVTAGDTNITATFGVVTATQPLTVTVPVLQSIAVLPANPSRLTLSTVPFTATGTYSDASTVDLTSQVAWNSSNTAVASFSSATATTATQGTTTISAALSGITGSTTLKATGGNLASITVNPYVVTLVKDTVSRITATGTFSDGSIRDITGVVSWSPADTSIATVLMPGGNLAWLQALVAGQTVISASSGSVTPATVTLTVTAPSVSSIAIVPTTLDLTVGTGSRFVVTGYFSDGTSQDVTASCDWSSDNLAAATVSKTGSTIGRVSGVAASPAQVTISAKYGGLTATAQVTVNARTLKDLAISGSTAVNAGNQIKFTATATYSDSSTVDVTESTLWAIDSPNVAILADIQNQLGQVVAVDKGTATLTASFNGIVKTATITVN